MQTPSRQSLAAFNTTRIKLPAQIGRATLYQCAETLDAIGNVRVCCAHAFQYAGHTMPEYHAKRLDAMIPKGDKLTLARAKRILSTWQRWTARGFPDLATVQGFIFALVDNR